MLNMKFNVLRFAVAGIVLCSGIFAACENLTETNANQTGSTFVEFTNLEQYGVTVYRDSVRQHVFAEVAANGSKVVAAAPSASGTGFYPTFHLDIFGVQGISIPYNGPGFITRIDADTTNAVSIPTLAFIQIDSAFIRITNNSVSSLTLRRGNSEESTLGFNSTLVNSGETAVYQIAPGPSSAYSIMANTVTPVAFPEYLPEFRPGIIYVFTYNGTSLTLEDEWSVLQTIPPAVPENVNAEAVSNNNVLITWDAVYGATSYRIYRATSAEGVYSSVGTSVTASFTDTTVSAGQAYYCITALSGANMESEGSAVVPVVMPNFVVQGSGLAAKLAWLQTNAESNRLYTVEIDADEYIVPQTLSYSGKSGVTITMSGVGGMRTVNLSALGRLFTISSGVTLILDNNLTLNGRSDNGMLVVIDSGGTMIMNEGTKITGNSIESGVSVSGTFTMNGGEISGNGRGVYVGGVFTMNGGEISGNNGSGVYVGGTFTMSRPTL